MTAITVSRLMSDELITLAADESLDLAQDIMRLGRIRHLPVVDGEQLVGLVTHRDLLRSQISALAGASRDEVTAVNQLVRIEEIMLRDVATVGPDTPAVEAARMMREKLIGCLPVVDDDRLVGIITEADFVALAIRFLESDA